MKKALFLSFLCLLALPAYPQDDDAYEGYPEYAEEDYQYDDAYEDAYGVDGEDAQPPVPEAVPMAEPAVAEITANTNSAPTQKEVYIPLFVDTAPNYVIDPANPKLPGNHPFLRLKGTLWRSDEVLLSTNSRGVVSARQIYFVFDAARPAVAFASAPYNAPTLSDYPPAEDYIELTPLLETNSYKASPYQGRYIEIPEKYHRPTAKPMMDAEAPSLPAQPAAPPEPALPPIDDEELLDNEVIEEPLDEYTEDYPEYDEVYTMLPLKYVAQNAAPETLTQVVVNIGGLEGGIFVYKTQNSATPYTVLFLALEKDNTLSVYTIQNSFDIRLDTPEITQARALYKKAFEVRANMKPFRRVNIPQSPIAPLLKDFFK